MRRSVTPTLVLACRKWTLVVSRRRSRKNVAFGAISGAKVGHRPKLDPDGCWEKNTPRASGRSCLASCCCCGRGECGAQHLLLLLQVKIKTFGAVLPRFPTDDRRNPAASTFLARHAPYFISTYKRHTHTNRMSLGIEAQNGSDFLDVN
jgi:hypothetical protein